MKYLVLVLLLATSSCALGYKIDKVKLSDGYYAVVNDRSMPTFGIYVADVTVYKGLKRIDKYTGIEIESQSEVDSIAYKVFDKYHN